MMLGIATARPRKSSTIFRPLQVVVCDRLVTGLAMITQVKQVSSTVLYYYLRRITKDGELAQCDRCLDGKTGCPICETVITSDFVNAVNMRSLDQRDLDYYIAERFLSQKLAEVATV